MSGIGKKSAEKIVLGLRDKLDDESWPGHVDSSDTNPYQPTHASDTIDALITLGYQPNDARRVVQQLPPDINNANDAVKEALRILSK
jgi:Holliday junction DNA helicase RuvA